MRFWTHLHAVWYDRTNEKGHTQKARYKQSNQNISWVITELGRYFWQRPKAVLCLRWAWVLQRSSQTLSLSDAKTVGQFLGGKTSDGGRRVWTENTITMVTANLHNLFVPVSTFNFFFPSLLLSVWLFLPTLGGCDVWSSSSVANDLRHDTLPLTDSRITARHVTQDKLRWWQLQDRVWVLRGVEGLGVVCQSGWVWCRGWSLYPHLRWCSWCKKID